MTSNQLIILAAAVLLGALLGYFFGPRVRMAPSGKVIVREGFGAKRVSFTSLFVIPALHKTSIVDNTLSNISLSFFGPDNPLISKDEQLFDLKVTLHLRIKDTVEDVNAAIEHFGLENISELDDRIPEMINDAEQFIRTGTGDLSWKQIADSATFKAALLQRLPKGYFKPGLVVEDIAFDHTDKFPPEISAYQGSGLLYKEL